MVKVGGLMVGLALLCAPAAQAVERELVSENANAQQRVSASANGRYVLLRTSDRGTVLHDRETGKAKRYRKAALVSPNAKVLVVVRKGLTIQPRKKGRARAVPVGRKGKIIFPSLAFSGDSKQLFYVAAKRAKGGAKQYGLYRYTLKSRKVMTVIKPGPQLGALDVTKEGDIVAFERSGVWTIRIDGGSEFQVDQDADGEGVGGTEPSISADGNIVAFTATTTAFAGQTEEMPRVYVRDLGGDTVSLVSDEAPAVGPSVDDDGVSIAYQELAADDDLVSDSAGPYGSVYMRRISGKRYLISEGDRNGLPVLNPKANTLFYSSADGVYAATLLTTP